MLCLFQIPWPVGGETTTLLNNEVTHDKKKLLNFVNFKILTKNMSILNALHSLARARGPYASALRCYSHFHKPGPGYPQLQRTSNEEGWASTEKGRINISNYIIMCK